LRWRLQDLPSVLFRIISKLGRNLGKNRKNFFAEIPYEEGTSFYGSGETPGSLLLNGRLFTAWPTDNPEYDENTDRCYQAHPFILAVRKDGSSYGIIFDTTFIITMDLHNGIRAQSPQPFSVIVIEKNSPQEVVSTLADLTGKIPLPPKWSLGYHQCRWSYYPQSRVLDVASEFRKRKIPADVIWLDIHYMDGYRIFTHDPITFPSPEKLNSDLHNIGFRSVWMIDPGVKRENGYFVHDQLIEGDMAVKAKNGDNFVGSVWPGPCVFPDFTMEKTREWWGGLYKDYLASGIDGVWNDMNEPSVFDTPTKTMPQTCTHRGYGGGDHSRFHNLYGMLMVKASRDGILKARPNKRPFVLSRSNYLGGQRYAATWTGDNHSRWNHLHMSIPMVLNLGLSGQPFSGPDIGGFAGNASPQLFQRWMGFGALLPFARGHTHHDSVNHEPWSFGPETEQICRVAITRRYILLPYLYTLFFISSRVGLPVVQPLFFVDPTDPKLRAEDRAFMLGESILVVTDIYADESRSSTVNVPTNVKWYPLTLDNFTHKDLPELKVREGTIFVTQSPIEHVDQNPEYLTLIVALDENKMARGLNYDDAGDGYEFEDGKFLMSEYEAQLIGDTFTLTISEEGAHPRRAIPLHIRVLFENREFTHTLHNTEYLSKIEFKINL